MKDKLLDLIYFLVNSAIIFFLIILVISITLIIIKCKIY